MEVCSLLHLLMAWGCQVQGHFESNENIGLIPYMRSNIYKSPKSILSWIFQSVLNTHPLEQQ